MNPLHETNFLLALAIIALYWIAKLCCYGHALQSWRTSFCGLVCIGFVVWSASVLWVPTNTILFNLKYVLVNQWPGIALAIGLYHARDHKAKS